VIHKKHKDKRQIYTETVYTKTNKKEDVHRNNLLTKNKDKRKMYTETAYIHLYTVPANPLRLVCANMSNRFFTHPNKYNRLLAEYKLLHSMDENTTALFILRLLN
jgi:hypothetical protein